MAVESNSPMIKVIGFKTTYERLPVKGDPLNDTVDDRGFKLDAKGKRVMSMQEVDWVTYAPAHAVTTSNVEERIKHLMPTEEMLASEPTEKVMAMRARWSQIEAEYRAYKSGHELPVNGTPLGAWAGILPAAADVLKRSGIKTVEEVARLSEAQIDKIQLPAMRDLRRSAKLFLDNRDAAESAQRETDRDREIELLKQQLAENNDRLSAAMEMLEDQNSAKDEVSSLRADLDRLGIKYHHKAGVDTLRGLLAEKSEAA